MKASAVEKTLRHTSAVSDAEEGDNVQGRSTITLTGSRSTAPQISEPAAGITGSRPLKFLLKMAAQA
ncbi:hypothetical protein D3C87_2151090 [compost metagenome]